MKRVLTYGTFDLLHYGHINLLRRAKALGDYLIVALSTDEFNESKGKKAYHDYETRKKMLEAIRYVDLVIPENSWEQKINDIKEYHVDVTVMGGDWAGSDKFEYLQDYCELVYLPRTEGISTSKIKKELGLQKPINGLNQRGKYNEKLYKEKQNKDNDFYYDFNISIMLHTTNRL